MQTVYELFRHLHLEWTIYTGILAFGLSRIFRSEGVFRKAALFIPGSLITCALLMPLVNLIPYTPVFASQGSSIWPCYLLFAANMTVWLAVCFREKVLNGLTYALYYLLLIVLVKGALVPLYNAETSLSRSLYIGLDIATILLLTAMLILVTVLFYRYRIVIEQGNAGSYYRLVFVIPIIFLITYSLFVSGSAFFQIHLQPIISGVLAFILPLVYYNMASGSKALSDSRELETALLRTRADLAHYRGIIELEDQVRTEQHELRNRYLHIRVLLHENRLEELERYLAEELGTRMAPLEETPVGNTLIDYILQMKKKEALASGIAFHLTVSLERKPDLSDELFCTILLNLLDNAIEASRSEENPEIRVSLTNRGAYLILQIGNRISRNILQVNPALTTTKADKRLHGHGVSIVKSAVRRAGGMIEIRTDEGFFDVKVALPDASAVPTASYAVPGASASATAASASAPAAQSAAAPERSHHV